MAKVVMMTAKQASEYTGIDKNAIKRAWTDPKFAHIFDGHTDELTFEGTDYKPVRRADQAAIDRWVAFRKTLTPGTRAGRTTGRRYIVHVKDDQRKAVSDALSALGVTLESPYVRKPKATAPTQPTNGETTEVFEHELVEA